MSKKRFWLKLGFFLFLLFSLFSFFFLISKQSSREVPQFFTERKEEKKEEKIDLILDFGEAKISTFSSVIAETPLEALEKISRQEDIELITKKYDFGVLVEQIGDKKNSSQKAWLYYVNGKMANEAADKFHLKNGDVVEWCYEEPKF